MRFGVWCLVLGALCVMAGCGKAPIERVEWPVMGTIAAVQTKGATAEETAKFAREAKEAFACVEKLLSAHDPNSELSRLAMFSEAEILERCDESVRPCYEMAFDLMRKSGGAFNPRWRGPETLDMGAVAKGFAVDLAADAVKECYEKAGENMPMMLIDLGGNLKAVKGAWTVGVKDGESFVLHEGEACATSARYYRGDHIKDGRTGETVVNDIYSVTVIHPKSAMLADGLSTTLFILGREKGEEFLKKHYSDARAVWLP